MMLELPEANVISKQLEGTILGREIVSVIMNSSPNKFAFYVGDPHSYHDFLVGKRIDGSEAYGGMVELSVQDFRLVFSDGVNLRIHEEGAQQPAKHQMLIAFKDGSALSGSVQMYGFLSCFKEGAYLNQYRDMAKQKPSPLDSGFDERYFVGLIEASTVQKLSLKAFLATEQRIPGLGNGVLQEILWTAKLHPKRKIMTLSQDDKDRLYHAIRNILRLMVTLGGRDTEKDLYGKPGGYHTTMSNLHAAEGCPSCGGSVTKEAYLGGSIYYCANCQIQ